MIGSFALDFEARRNPDLMRRTHALGILGKASSFVGLSLEVQDRARSFERSGIKPLDALHLACAVEADADYFCTCDDRLLKRARAVQDVPPKVVSPLELILEVGI